MLAGPPSSGPISPRPHIAVVADDLTSASDAAVGFARAGWSATVLLGPACPVPFETDVVAVDVDSRACTADEATARVASATRAVAGAPVVVKTFDSTLRGNIGAELHAALSASGRRSALVVPAFPTYGRTTVNGVQLLDGVPVHLGPAGRDPVTPTRTSDVVELLGGRAGRVRCLTADAIGDSDLLTAQLDSADFVVVDARTDDHLDALVASVVAPHEVLWAGSTGLSQALGRVWRQAGGERVADAAAERVVVAVGSLNPVSRRQLARLRQRLAPGADSATHRPQAAGSLTVLASPDPPGLVVDRASAQRVASNLGSAVAALVEQGADGLVLTGGDTAIAAMRALGASGMVVHREVEPGIAHGVLRGPRAVQVVTKAGGFGSEEALVACVSALNGVGAA